MRIIIAATLLLFACNSFAQKKGYSSIAAAVDVKDRANAFGLYFSGNGQMAPGSFIGIEAGVIKFKGVNAPYIPLLAKITVAPNIDKNKLSPLVVVAPGYGTYSHNATGNTTTGGFDFYGGLGVVTASKTKTHAFITIGYSRYGFTTQEIKSKIEMVGLRTGLMFK
jgi:hypothetical protein